MFVAFVSEIPRENIAAHANNCSWLACLRLPSVEYRPWIVSVIGMSSLATTLLIYNYCYKSAHQERDKEAFQQFFLPGLPNHGNTCYINATLQVQLSQFPYSIGPVPNVCIVHYKLLSSLDRFHMTELSFIPLTDMPNWIKELDRLLELLRQPNPTPYLVDPGPFFAALMGNGKQIGLNTDQQDAHEFLQILLDRISVHGRKTTPKGCLQLAAAKEAETGLISLLPWEGLLETRLTCLNCARLLSIKLCLFNVLTLHPNDSQANENPIASLLQQLQGPECIQGYRCELCQERRGCSSITKIVRYPKLWFIHIQRTIISGGRHLAKTTRPFDKLEKMLIPPETMHRYALCGIVEHQGRGIGCGHYIAHKRVALINGNSRRRNIWVSISDRSALVGSFASCSSQPYILAYQRISQ